MVNNKNQTKCGVGVLILQNDKILLGKRKGPLASGLYGSGGGHLEYGESFQDAIIREILEEAGVELENLEFLCISNFMIESKHYIDIGFTANIRSGEPKVMEPEKLESWNWYNIEDIPSPLFGVINNYIEALKTGKRLFDLSKN